MPIFETIKTELEGGKASILFETPSPSSPKIGENVTNEYRKNAIGAGFHHSFYKVEGIDDRFIVSHPENLSPLDIRAVIYADDAAPQMLEQRALMLLGDLELFPAKKEINDKGQAAFRFLKSTEKVGGKSIQYLVDFFEENSFEDEQFRIKQAKSYKLYGNVFTLFYRNKSGRVVKYKNIPYSTIFALTRKEGEDETLFYAIKIQTKNGDTKFVKVPAFRKELGINNPPIFILHTQDYFPDSEYYFYPRFIGAFRTLRIRNLIKKFHEDALVNGFSLKYHIKIPGQIIAQKLNAYKLENNESSMTFKKVRDEIHAGIIKELKGRGSSAISTLSYVDPQTQTTHDVEIKVLDGSDHHKQYVELATHYEQTTGQAFQSVNATRGVESGNNSNFGGSGSEVRNFFNMGKMEQTVDFKNLMRYRQVIAIVEGFSSQICWKKTDTYMVTGDVNHQGVVTK